MGIGSHPRWVSQEDAQGCSLAVLAMILDRTYAEVKAEVEAAESPRDWEKEGTTFYTLDRILAAHGYFIQRRYKSWGVPLEPFAAIHYASVQQPSNRGHFVCVLANGDVLDPLREGRYRLSDWEKVNQLVGLHTFDPRDDMAGFIGHKGLGDEFVSWARSPRRSEVGILREATETLRGVSKDLRTPTMAALADRIDVAVDALVAERDDALRDLHDLAPEIAADLLLVLEQFGWHTIEPMCDAITVPATGPCTCGYAAVLERWIPTGDGSA